MPAPRIVASEELSLSCLHLDCAKDVGVKCAAAALGPTLLERRAGPDLPMHTTTAAARSGESAALTTPALSSATSSQLSSTALSPALSRPPFGRSHTDRDDALVVAARRHGRTSVDVSIESVLADPSYFPTAPSLGASSSSFAPTTSSVPPTPDDELGPARAQRARPTSLQLCAHPTLDNLPLSASASARLSAATDLGRRLSAVGMLGDVSGSMQLTADVSRGPGRPSRASGVDAADAVPVASLMDGHFGPAVRSKVVEILGALLDDVPMLDEEVATLVEFGAVNSRSPGVMRSVIAQFNRRHAEGSSETHFFCVHAGSPRDDWRPIAAQLNSGDSYLSPSWLDAQSLRDRVFSSMIARPFGSVILPPASVSVAYSMLDLHWPQNSATGSPAAVAQAEFETFLTARASEIKRGGVLVVAFAQREEDPSWTRNSVAGGENLVAQRMLRGRSGSSPVASSTSAPLLASAVRRSDFYGALQATLAPCIQRLISTKLISIDLASPLLALPLYPRTPRQTKLALRSTSHLWSVAHACGLGIVPAREADGDATPLPMPTCEGALHVAHPACKAREAGLMPSTVFAEHVLELLRTLCLRYWRSVLLRHGRLGRSQVEFVLDRLLDTLREKIEEGAMAHVELDFTILALRRL